MALNGTDVLLRVDGNIVGSQRGVKFSETTAEIDVSSKEHREMYVLPGRYGATIQLDALYVPDDTAYMALLAAMRDGTFVEVIRQEDGATLESCSAIVTALDGDAPDQVAVVISVSLRVNGPWVEGS
jgi:predicted secreted protein